MLLILLVTIALTTEVYATLSPLERGIIADCLERYGGFTHEHAERLQRYKDWADNYEEIPCFTSCYLNKLANIYTEQYGFNATEVIRQFGRPIYSACQRRLLEGRHNCDVAYNGFHCLVKLQNDPFMVIEGLQNVSAQAKAGMSGCLRKFDQKKWDQVSEYSTFPVREPIPCYTKCFVDVLQLLSPQTRQWNTNSMRSQLGVPTEHASISHCQALSKKRKRNACKWVYQEFTCFVLAMTTN